MLWLSDRGCLIGFGFSHFCLTSGRAQLVGGCDPVGMFSFGLPRKQKIAVNKFWVQESEIGEECRQFWT